MEVSKSLCQLEDNFTLTSSHCIRGSHFKKSKFISEPDNKLEILKCLYVCKYTKLSLVFWTGASTSLHYTSLTWTFVLLYIFIWKWNTNKQQTFEVRFHQILLEKLNTVLEEVTAVVCHIFTISYVDLLSEIVLGWSDDRVTFFFFCYVSIKAFLDTKLLTTPINHHSLDQLFPILKHLALQHSAVARWCENSIVFFTFLQTDSDALHAFLEKIFINRFSRNGKRIQCEERISPSGHLFWRLTCKDTGKTGKIKWNKV